MVDESESGGGFSLKRWSRRKLASARAPAADDLPDRTRGAMPAPLAASAEGSALALPTAAASDASAVAHDVPALPAVESLTHESDFAPFLKPEVDDLVRRAALKKLFSDPHFNVMDGLDTYIGDYSQPDPLPAEWLTRMRSAQFIISPPATRVNALGHVEDVPPDEEAKAGTADESTADTNVADVSAAVAETQQDTDVAPVVPEIIAPSKA